MTYRKSMTQFSLLVIAIFVIIQTIMASYQTADASQLPQTWKGWAEFAKREWLGPVLENLRRNSKGDQKLLDDLNQIDLWTLTKPEPGHGPNAYIELKGGKPVIYVDLVFLRESFWLSELAGLALTGREEVRPIVRSFGFDCGKSFAHAAANNLEKPSISFSIDKYTNDPVLLIVTKRLSQEAFNGGIAWIVLHEVGHHRCKHFQKNLNSLSLEDLRKLEIEADNWAFSEMKKMGYGFAPVNAFLAAYEVLETLELLSGISQPESDSDHPSFSTRRKNLETLYNTTEPPRHGFLGLITVSRDDQGELKIIETAIPRDPESEGWPYAIQGDSFLPYEWKKGQISIYGRSSEKLNEVIVHQPDEIITDITYREILLKDGSVAEIKNRAFQVDYAPVQNIGIGTLKFSDLMKSSPRKFFLKVLTQVTTRPNVVNSAEASYMKHAREIRQILIQYARGQLSDAVARQQIAVSNESNVAELRKILGDTRYNQFRDLLMSDPAYKIFLERQNYLEKKQK